MSLIAFLAALFLSTPALAQQSTSWVIWDGLEDPNYVLELPGGEGQNTIDFELRTGQKLTLDYRAKRFCSMIEDRLLIQENSDEEYFPEDPCAYFLAFQLSRFMHCEWLADELSRFDSTKIIRPDSQAEYLVYAYQKIQPPPVTDQDQDQGQGTLIVAANEYIEYEVWRQDKVVIEGGIVSEESSKPHPLPSGIYAIKHGRNCSDQAVVQSGQTTEVTIKKRCSSYENAEFLSGPAPVGAPPPASSPPPISRTHYQWGRGLHFGYRYAQGRFSQAPNSENSSVQDAGYFGYGASYARFYARGSLILGKDWTMDEYPLFLAIQAEVGEDLLGPLIPRFGLGVFQEWQGVDSSGFSYQHHAFYLKLDWAPWALASRIDWTRILRVGVGYVFKSKGYLPLNSEAADYRSVGPGYYFLNVEVDLSLRLRYL